MHYKTMVLDLLEQEPELYERLRRSRILRAAVDLYATELGKRHLTWEQVIGRTKLGSSQCQIAGEALELAVEELKDCLASVAPSPETDTLSLDDAMAFLRRQMPPA